METKKAIFCWSGGKDSSLCLYKVLQEGEYEVKYLLTTINENFKRVSMHGVREELIEKQAETIGIPLKKMYVREAHNDEYDRNMQNILLEAKDERIEYVIFGDIFLEDLRQYRENNLAKVGMNAVFPLWKRDTRELMDEFLSLGFRTITCCVNDFYLNESRVGVEIDNEFLSSLPENVDPCGENGEFHTFCFEGPLFRSEIGFRIGRKVYKPLEINIIFESNQENQTKGFWYCDLIPV